MGGLKGGANNEAEAERLTLGELNKLIVNAEFRFVHGELNSALRKDAFKRLLWLEAQREKRVPTLRQASQRHTFAPARARLRH